MAKTNKLSPMMQQYQELKKEYPDTILMYRLGDFYEMFFEDAVTASAVLDLTLTGRDCGLDKKAPMCGVPHHAVDNYISRLITAGHKIAICEQLSAPGDQKGMVKRGVVRVVTAGTVTSDDMLSQKSNNYLCSVKCIKDSFGIAWADITTGELNCREFLSANKEVLYDFLLYISPSEIICDRQTADIINNSNVVVGSKLVRATSFYDYSFDLDNATNKILSHFKIFSLESLGLHENRLAVCAVGGLLEYIFSTQKRDLTNIVKISYQFDNKFMHLDYNTKRDLELIESTNSTKNNSLLSVLDHTSTNMGGRQLKRWILQPLQNIDDIKERQAGVKELITNTSMRSLVENSLTKIKDIERLSGKISYNSIMPRDCNSLKKSLQQIPVLKEILRSAKSEILKKIRDNLGDFTSVATKLDNAIVEDDCPATIKDGNYIKPGFSEELDRLRYTHINSTQTLKSYEESQRNATGCNKLKIGYNRIFGYYIEIPNSQKTDKLPFDYVRKQTVASGERYTSGELQKLENDILGASERILKIEEKIYTELKDYLFTFVNQFQNSSSFISILDCLSSLAEVAQRYNYVCPKFSTKDQLVIIDGRHPVVEKLHKSRNFVPNDTILDKSSFTSVITGPNMAGKSTYIRQVAVIVLMAHIGSFVPANKVELSIVDRIFTRVGASDNLILGQSTFMVEMLEVANILNNATNKSLLILDEIGRGTSTLDGLSIAWAILEHINLNLKSKTLFATHYHELSELEYILEGIRNYRILVQEHNGEIKFLYKIARGGANKSFGIEVASLAGIDKNVIARAKHIMKSLASSHELSGGLTEKLSSNISEFSIAGSQASFFEEDITLTELKRILNDTDIDRCTPIEALTILSDLKKVIVKE